MLLEQNFLQDQIAVLRKRLNAVQESTQPAEKPASSRLVRAYDISNKTVENLKKQLVEILGKEDAFEMIEDARREAEVWWSMQRAVDFKQNEP